MSRAQVCAVSPASTPGTVSPIALLGAVGFADNFAKVAVAAHLPSHVSLFSLRLLSNNVARTMVMVLIACVEPRLLGRWLGGHGCILRQRFGSIMLGTHEDA
jgi:hypothetical protein